MGLGVATRAFFKALFDTTFANQVGELLTGKALPKPEEKPSDALRLLTVLQRDGRLIDFLMEQVDGYPDEQLGAAVRQIQKDCRSALGKYVTLAPIMKEEEGQKVTIQPGFDAKRVRLTGNVPGQGPYKGELAHRGWQATELRLSELTGLDPMVLAPAEVEIS